MVTAAMKLKETFSLEEKLCKPREHIKKQRHYLQGSNEETDIENRLMDMGRGDERVRCMGRVTWKLTLLYVK